MKLKSFGLAMLMAVALMVFASTASATSLEITGVKQLGSIVIKKSLKPGTSALWSDTFGAFANTCTVSTVEGKTSVFTGTTVSGPISALSWSSCKEEKVVVDTTGSFSIENIAGTTNGTVRSIGSKVTVPSPFGLLTCVTAASPGTDLGTITGVLHGTATWDFVAVLSCPISVRLTATYSITAPQGFGVTS